MHVRKKRSLNLKINLSKVLLSENKVSYFGVEISENGINADPSKIEVLKHASPPQNFSELRISLGLCNCVSKLKVFCEENVKLCELFKKNKLFVWKERKSSVCL